MIREFFNFIKWTVYFYVGIFSLSAFIYAFTASESSPNYMESTAAVILLLILIPGAPILAYYRRKKMGPPKKRVKARKHSKDYAEEQTVGSSTTAKVALGMSAVALAKSKGPTKVPTCVPREGGARNINTVHKKGNKYVVTYETLHPSTGWQRDKKEIEPGISGWSHWGGMIDVHWDNI